ncbi:hypothetical protein LXL04_004940 [Taraxacum kok-saghyz]
MAATSVKEVLPPVLDSTSQPPPLFDGTTRLYTSLQCPFAQRVWITRNYKGLQDKIKLVPIDLANRPAWYKEKVYPENKVPSLEHDNKIIGESLDLVKYLDTHFEGPSLLPNDPAKKEFLEELWNYTDTFNKTLNSSFKGDAIKEAGVAFDYLESALEKFEGPFLLGEISLVDFVYIPFVERFHLFFQEVLKYDITSGRPKLATWIEELNKIDAYTQTKANPEYVVKFYKKRFLRAVQMRTIIGGGNGGTNLGHLFHFAVDQFFDAGALLSAQHISFENSYIPENPRTPPISYISQTVIPFKKSTSGPSKTFKMITIR